MSTEVMSNEARAMTPAQRMTKGLCPECGVDLSAMDARAHRDHHWPRKPSSDENAGQAFVRYKMLTDFAAQHAVKRDE